jgi:CBS domain-containing protein
MKLASHVKLTKKSIGVKAEDIHQWIDGLFEHDKFKEYCRTGIIGDFNPYAHREHRHCQEALEECIDTFKDEYLGHIITAVFESHVKADYNGYFPKKKDFKNPQFHNKYHTK